MKLTEIIRGSGHGLSLFSDEKIATLEARIVERKKGSKIALYAPCLVRGREVMLTPEEVVRQLYLMVLTQDLGYPPARIALEHEVTFGREKKRADIVIFDQQRPDAPYIIVEVKSPGLKEGKDQLKSYCNATGAPIGVWSNGQAISYYNRQMPNYFVDISNIPRVDQKLSDILSERWTIDDLISRDKLVNERKSLKGLILEMEDEVLSGAGVDVFEEVFKLIFAKLFDELESWRNGDRNLEFRNYGDTETELYSRIQSLFERACRKWDGVFPAKAKIELIPSHLSVCVASLQDVKLFSSSLDVVDEAFEYLINKSSKGEKGQYFTPRYVIDMCVRMLNPQPHERIIDTAAGSCGFPVHTIFHVWGHILQSKGIARSRLFTLQQKPAECADYVNDNVFAIDFDERAVRVARMLNLIAGDGQTNVLHLNTLDYERWERNLESEAWRDAYYEGWKKLRGLCATKGSYHNFMFDIVMANPPFAGDVKDSRILAKYDVSRKVELKKIQRMPEGATVVQGEPTFPEVLANSPDTVYQRPDGSLCKASLKQVTSVSRDALFVERNLDFLKPGGRMAIVLPQGCFNNITEKALREYITSRCRILAVVGLHGNVFKPHTGTKTSVLIVQKWDDELCPRVDDYNIFFATMQEPSKDSRGDKIYRYTTNEAGESILLLDTSGYPIVKHDLFNHDGLTGDGIAEAFMEFAKREQLSFFAQAPSMR